MSLLLQRQAKPLASGEVLLLLHNLASLLIMLWVIICQEAPAFGGINGCQTVETEQNLQLGGQKHAALSESLKSSLDHLNNEVFLCVNKFVVVIVLAFFHYSYSSNYL